MGLAILTRENLANATARARGPAPDTGTVPGVPDGFVDKLVKLIPTEVVGFYLGVISLLGPSSTSTTKITAFVIGLGLSVLVLSIPTTLPDGSRVRPPPSQYVLRMIAFVLWATALNQPLASIHAFDPQLVVDVA